MTDQNDLSFPHLSFWKSRELARDGSFWFIVAKVIAVTSVKKYCWERVAINVKADLQWLKARHHKYHLMDCAFNKCYHILRFNTASSEEYCFMAQLCDAETMNLWCMVLKKERGMLPSASHMDRSSFWLTLSFKNDHCAWLQLFFHTLQCNLSVYFPSFYSSAMVMDDKAHGVSGVPWTKALWPSAMAWLCQSPALLTAE